MRRQQVLWRDGGRFTILRVAHEKTPPRKSYAPESFIFLFDLFWPEDFWADLLGWRQLDARGTSDAGEDLRR